MLRLTLKLSMRILEGCQITGAGYGANSSRERDQWYHHLIKLALGWDNGSLSDGASMTSTLELLMLVKLPEA